MRKIDPVLRQRLATLITSMGYELYGCQLIPQGRRVIFRIYIDKPKGVTLDDCSKVSHQVSAMMDVEDPIRERYTLEISSPGIDRPLLEKEHYERYIGDRVKIRLSTSIEKRKQFQGLLVRVVGDDIYLLADETHHEMKLPYAAIEKANLIGDI